MREGKMAFPIPWCTGTNRKQTSPISREGPCGRSCPRLKYLMEGCFGSLVFTCDNAVEATWICGEVGVVAVRDSWAFLTGAAGGIQTCKLAYITLMLPRSYHRQHNTGQFALSKLIRLFFWQTYPTYLSVARTSLAQNSCESKRHAVRGGGGSLCPSRVVARRRAAHWPRIPRPRRHLTLPGVLCTGAATARWSDGNRNLRPPPLVSVG